VNGILVICRDCNRRTRYWFYGMDGPHETSNRAQQRDLSGLISVDGWRHVEGGVEYEIRAVLCPEHGKLGPIEKVNDARKRCRDDHTLSITVRLSAVP
jgi:hypothetical protein